MSNEADIRIPKRISTEELERRWKAVRQAMGDKKLDLLILQNYSGNLGGYHRWFTDVAAGYISTIIFPRDDEMTLIGHGARPPAPPSPPAWQVRGVKKCISVPIVPSLGYSTTYDAEVAVEELAPYKNCRIGLVNTGFMSAAFYKYLTQHMDSVSFEDATDMVDNIKAVKSDEEIKLIKEACALQDEVFKYTLTRVQAGKRDYEVRADVLQKAAELGAENAMIAVGSAPAGVASRMMPAPFGNRVIEDGDQVTFLIETNGPGGCWGELAKIICLGKVSSELETQFKLAQEAQKLSLGLLKPGASPSAIFEANNAFLKSKGYPEEGRIYAHGQGYDMVERPSLDPGETMIIQARMNIAVHPEVVSPQAFGWVCENYIVSEDGDPVCLHKTPQKIFVI